MNRWERDDVFSQDPEIQELRSQLSRASQQAASRRAEADTRIAALLIKSPAQMTAEDFQTYLLIEQMNFTRQHAENHRSWQKFDVLFRTIPVGIGVVLGIVAATK